jgi:hypothetical protein
MTVIIDRTESPYEVTNHERFDERNPALQGGSASALALDVGLRTSRVTRPVDGRNSDRKSEQVRKRVLSGL